MCVFGLWGCRIVYVCARVCIRIQGWASDEEEGGGKVGEGVGEGGDGYTPLHRAS